MPALYLIIPDRYYPYFLQHYIKPPANGRLLDFSENLPTMSPSAPNYNENVNFTSTWDEHDEGMQKHPAISFKFKDLHKINSVITLKNINRKLCLLFTRVTFTIRIFRDGWRWLMLKLEPFAILKLKQSFCR